MGGARYAQFLAALATALAPAYVGICGILSMNSFDILFWAALWIVAGLVVARRWRVFRSWYVWAGGALAGEIFLPHLLWQWHHGWPTLEFVANATREKNVSPPHAAFVAQQVMQLGALAARVRPSPRSGRA
jgi:hypothetical protein